MDPRPPRGNMMLAPGVAARAPSMRLPAARAFPPVDDHLVEPEITRNEVIRGRKVVAQPAREAHGDRHFELDFVLRGSVAEGYVGSTDLITRVNAGSDFASDTCIRKEGIDPATQKRWLEEVAFEIVNTQSMSEVIEKAEDLAARGVRRVFAIFVKKGRAAEWSAADGAFVMLDPEASIEDPTLLRPLRVKALLDAVEADNAVARGLVDKHNPVIEAIAEQRRDAGRREGHQEGLVEGKRAALLAVFAARGLSMADEERARILACHDAQTIDRWIAAAVSAGSVREALGPAI